MLAQVQWQQQQMMAQQQMAAAQQAPPPTEVPDQDVDRVLEEFAPPEGGQEMGGM